MPRDSTAAQRRGLRVSLEYTAMFFHGEAIARHHGELANQQPSAARGRSALQRAMPSSLNLDGSSCSTKPHLLPGSRDMQLCSLSHRGPVVARRRRPSRDGTNAGGLRH
ncbi:hypothetical protein MRS44_007866 [Fusarium solani]|uniref:uncharacterized protein n=1 Tax=Fusarium solani TaxID=169388 RepID=UPI002317963C|nr:hypothetical protein MRS44_007866 [Fusarium solani]KAJ4222712.1 hypothetical protein NW759_006290 [Fusarium solani]